MRPFAAFTAWRTGCRLWPSDDGVTLRRRFDRDRARALDRGAARRIDEPLVLIAGGRDKHLPMEDWAELIAQRVKHVVLLGEMSDLVQEAITHA